MIVRKFWKFVKRDKSFNQMPKWRRHSWPWLSGCAGPVAGAVLRHRDLRRREEPQPVLQPQDRRLESGSPLGTYGKAWQELGGAMALAGGSDGGSVG